ncbi:MULTISPECIES: hypothetical protein [unclassified Roseovarius]|uniref:hypothetical protein n=1 Tax=unclassified Roseovarius TaxID=2614913 RepID=UPI00273D5D43|nr:MULTISPECIES: hypothetical protein [unclassified Roseovarius]
MTNTKTKPATKTARTTRASNVPQRIGSFIPIGELATRILTNFPERKGEGLK